MGISHCSRLHCTRSYHWYAWCDDLLDDYDDRYSDNDHDDHDDHDDYDDSSSDNDHDDYHYNDDKWPNDDYDAAQLAGHCCRRPGADRLRRQL
jgi:hypothetical protein